MKKLLVFLLCLLLVAAAMPTPVLAQQMARQRPTLIPFDSPGVHIYGTIYSRYARRLRAATPRLIMDFHRYASRILHAAGCRSHIHHIVDVPGMPHIHCTWRPSPHEVVDALAELVIISQTVLAEIMVQGGSAMFRRPHTACSLSRSRYYQKLYDVYSAEFRRLSDVYTEIAVRFMMETPFEWEWEH